MNLRRTIPFCAPALALLCLAGPAWPQAKVEGRNIRIEFDTSLHSRVVAKLAGKEITIGAFNPSETITAGGTEVKDFAFKSRKTENVRDKLGAGRRVTITGAAPGLQKAVAVTVYDDFPQMAFYEVSYTNAGQADLAVSSWTNNRYSLTPAAGAADPAFWSFQGGSYSNRPNWIVPVKAGFKQENFQGMNSTDYGGGTPVSDVWRRDAGLGVGHIEMVPKLVSLPVTMPDAQAATVAVTYKQDQPLKPKATLKTFRTFVAVHQGDYFKTLQDYSRAMVKQGIQFNPSPESAFGPIWCAWGYGRGFTMSQVFGALPIVRKLGFTWVTLDDGWQTSEGDWFLDPTKYPAGDKDMRAFVDGIHKEGFKAQLWWAPLAIDPGTKAIEQHPEWLLKNADGSNQKITYWNSLYACPADPAVVEFFRQQVIKYIKDWDYDGLKLDGQFMNQVPPCYNPAHKHARPEDSVEQLPAFFKMIYDTARSIKPDAVVEYCPCGDNFSYFMLPHMNMSVASDPRGSIQVRGKGKTLKALHGDKIAYFGDHVRLTPNGESFATTVGIGGVLGTNFTWPVGSRPVPPPRPGAAPKKGGGDTSGGQAVAGRPGNELNPELEKVFGKWMDIYKGKMLPHAEYMGSLYDIGYDLPETHALRKGRNMYYSFYATEFNGKVELRGLGEGSYKVADYVNGKDFGTVRGPLATINAEFKDYLLLEARPEY